MVNRIRCLLADDHVLFRQGLRRLLEAEPEFEVVAEAGATDEAVRLARLHRPHLVLLDLTLPGPPAWETARVLRRVVPEAATVAVTMHEDTTLVRRMLAAGARGYWPKSAGAAELIRALRQVARGGVALHPRALNLLAAPGSAPDTAGARLTAREREILERVAAGETPRTIARRLYLSEKTVRNHLARAKAKLGVADRTQLALWALHHGLATGGAAGPPDAPK